MSEVSAVRTDVLSHLNSHLSRGDKVSEVSAVRTDVLSHLNSHLSRGDKVSEVSAVRVCPGILVV